MGLHPDRFASLYVCGLETKKTPPETVHNNPDFYGAGRDILPITAHVGRTLGDAFNTLAPVTTTLFVLLAAQVAQQSLRFRVLVLLLCACEYLAARILLFKATLAVHNLFWQRDKISYVYEELSGPLEKVARWLLAAILISLAGYLFVTLEPEKEEKDAPRSLPLKS